MKIGIGQLNPTVGDFTGNQEKMQAMIQEAKSKGVELLVFPELITTGYPPKDLLCRRDFITANLRTAQKIIDKSEGMAIIFGYVEKGKGRKKWQKGLNLYDKSLTPFFSHILYNSALFVYNRRVLGKIRKINLPSYDVFDEKRYFTPGEVVQTIKFKGRRLGINICEDIWVEEVVEEQIKKGAEIIINISASPFYIGKHKIRSEMIKKKARKNGCYIIYCNICGGQDDLIFDGGSFVVHPQGKMIAEGKRFAEELLIFDLPPEAKPSQLFQPSSLSSEEEIISALSLGLADYVKKNGFRKVCLGLSGGIDSSITAAIAAQALGSENTLGVIMPGPYTKRESIEDARQVARNLGIPTLEIDINPIYHSYLAILNQSMGKGIEVMKGKDATGENIQARIRGNLLMAISNKFGHLVLSTGNKSEMAVGYTTLYGDMAGGLAIIADLPKSLIYKLAVYLNKRAEKEIIPQRVITKPPSAELRPNQRDEDDLLPYSLLDKILYYYIEENLTPSEIIKKGFSEKDVKKVIRLCDKSEYKRKQAPLGLKLTNKAFGFGWRLPITNKFIDQSIGCRVKT